jgi:hypothetical protein
MRCTATQNFTTTSFVCSRKADRFKYTILKCAQSGSKQCNPTAKALSLCIVPTLSLRKVRKVLGQLVLKAFLLLLALIATSISMSKPFQHSDTGAVSKLQST